MLLKSRVHNSEIEEGVGTLFVVYLQHILNTHGYQLYIRHFIVAGYRLDFIWPESLQ